MKVEPLDIHTIEVEADDLLRIQVYEPGTPFLGHDRTEFSATVSAELAEHLIGPFNRARKFYEIKSRKRPQVEPGAKSVDGLVRDLQRLDAMNISRDRIFSGEMLVLTVQRYHYNFRNHEGHGLALVSVRFATNRRNW